MPLTDTACKAAKCPADKRRARFTDSNGLYLEVVATGGKHWRWKYRFAGKEKRLALGSYPAVGLAQARRARDLAREQLRSGKDPVQEKREAKAATLVRRENSFEAVATAWFEHWKGPKTARHSEYVLRRLKADVFPEIGRRPIAEVTAPMLVAMAKKIEARDALDVAKRALQTCGQIFRYAVAHGQLERNAAADVKPADALRPRRKTHYARLDARELPELQRKIAVYQGTPWTRLAIKLMALTFVRTGELISARWDEFDLERAEWRIPPERMKMRTTHIVPLSTQALEVVQLLEELRNLSPFVFPGERDHEKPMSNNTILAALARMGYKHRMTGHGFRAIASTVLHEHGFDHAVIETQLAHLHGDEVSRAYNAALYLPQRRKMMQWWADHLDELRQGAKIIALKAA